MTILLRSLKGRDKRKQIEVQLLSKKIDLMMVQDLSYFELQYLLIDKQVELSVIKLILSQFVSKESLNDWKTKIGNQIILNHMQLIRQKSIDQHWKSTRMKKQTVTKQQQTYSSYVQHYDQQNFRNRISQLKVEIAALDVQIHTIRDEGKNMQCRKLYERKMKELSFWRNKKRKIRECKEDKKIVQQFCNPVLDSIYQKIEQINQLNCRNSLAVQVAVHRHPSQNKCKFRADSQISAFERIQLIFNVQAKKSGNQNMLFDEIKNSQNYVTQLNCYKLFNTIHNFRLLSQQQKNNFFKQNCNFNKKIHFNQFAMMLQRICQHQCFRLKIQFKASVLIQFLHKFADSAENISQKIKNHRNNGQFIELRNAKQSSYRYKLKSHTGKLSENIQEIMHQKKQIKAKLKTYKKIQLNASKSVALTPTLQSSLTEVKSIKDQSYYFSIYKQKLKRQKLKLKTSKTFEPLSQQLDQLSIINYKDRLSQGKKYSLNRNKTESKQLSEIVRIHQSDEFLTQHLNYQKLRSNQN